MTTQHATLTTSDCRRDFHQMMLQSSVDGGRELLANGAEMLRRYAEEMERYASRYDDCDNDTSVTYEMVLSWAINHVVQLHSNLRLDLFVSKAAEIAERRQLVAQTETEA